MDDFMRQRTISLVAASIVIAAIVFGQMVELNRDRRGEDRISILESKVDSSTAVSLEIRDVQMDMRDGFDEVLDKMDRRSRDSRALLMRIEKRLNNNVSRVAAKVETVKAEIDTVQSVLPKPKKK